MAICSLSCDLSHRLVQELSYFRGYGVQSFRGSNTGWTFPNDTSNIQPGKSLLLSAGLLG